jgi:hypothetical protein
VKQHIGDIKHGLINHAFAIPPRMAFPEVLAGTVVEVDYGISARNLPKTRFGELRIRVGKPPWR